MDSRNQIRALLFLAVALLLGAATGAAVHAQSGGGYDLTWWTVDGGGEAVEGGGMTLRGTAGQPEAGPALSGGGYTLVGGFWPGGGVVAHRVYVYLPLALRSP